MVTRSNPTRVTFYYYLQLLMLQKVINTIKVNNNIIIFLEELITLHRPCVKFFLGCDLKISHRHNVCNC
jgi:hypothetical protein